jgi:Sec-independent protein translocase protein TatA
MITAFDDKQIVRFLLGQLAEDKRTGIEDRMFTDDRFYEQVLAIQEELADDYVLENLTPDQRTAFERNFLRSPQRRERVEFATAFTRALESQTSSETSVAFDRRAGWWRSLFGLSNGFQWATVAGALALLIGASWLYVQNRTLSRSIEVARSENQELLNSSRDKDAAGEAQRQKLEHENADLRNQMKATIEQKDRELKAAKSASEAIGSSILTQIATFTLSPGLTRGSDEPEKVMISGKTQVIQLQLALPKPENYKGYLAEVRTARGNLVFSKSVPAAQQLSFGQAVSLTLPANQIPIGEYEVTLKGAADGKLQSVGYYYFIALKR